MRPSKSLVPLLRWRRRYGSRKLAGSRTRWLRFHACKSFSQLYITICNYFLICTKMAYRYHVTTTLMIIKTRQSTTFHAESFIIIGKCVHEKLLPNSMRRKTDCNKNNYDISSKRLQNNKDLIINAMSVILSTLYANCVYVRFFKKKSIIFQFGTPSFRVILRTSLIL